MSVPSPARQTRVTNHLRNPSPARAAGGAALRAPMPFSPTSPDDVSTSPVDLRARRHQGRRLGGLCSSTVGAALWEDEDAFAAGGGVEEGSFVRTWSTLLESALCRARLVCGARGGGRKASPPPLRATTRSQSAKRTKLFIGPTSTQLDFWAKHFAIFSKVHAGLRLHLLPTSPSIVL